jgi:DNA-binding LytR/AlgR family response regulator
MSSLNILIVEDEFLVAADLEESLLDLGYRVQNCVATGQGAIDEVEKNLPDIILMDIVLKGTMNGIEAATLIQQKHNVPIIYLTANADIGTVEKAKFSLPYGYILKPFTEKELQTNIEIARFKFENDMKSKMESDQFNKFFKLSEQQKDVLIIEADGGTLDKVKLPDIYYIEEDGAYCKIHLFSDTMLVKLSLLDMAKRLPEDKFLRVNDDCIVNTDRIFMAKYPEIIIADKMSVITVDEAYKQQLESRVSG